MTISDWPPSIEVLPPAGFLNGRMPLFKLDQVAYCSVNPFRRLSSHLGEVARVRVVVLGIYAPPVNASGLLGGPQYLVYAPDAVTGVQNKRGDLLDGGSAPLAFHLDDDLILRFGDEAVITGNIGRMTAFAPADWVEEEDLHPFKGRRPWH